jgi:hypothetical protein
MYSVNNEIDLQIEFKFASIFIKVSDIDRYEFSPLLEKYFSIPFLKSLKNTKNMFNLLIKIKILMITSINSLSY